MPQIKQVCPFNVLSYIGRWFALAEKSGRHKAQHEFITQFTTLPSSSSIPFFLSLSRLPISFSHLCPLISLTTSFTPFLSPSYLLFHHTSSYIPLAFTSSLLSLVSVISPSFTPPILFSFSTVFSPPIPLFQSPLTTPLPIALRGMQGVIFSLRIYFFPLPQRCEL